MVSQDKKIDRNEVKKFKVILDHVVQPVWMELLSYIASSLLDSYNC